MPVIKSEDAPVQQLGAFSMADIEKQAKAILIAARVRAERFIHAAQQDADEMKRRVHAEAKTAGMKEGLVRGTEEGRALGREEALAEQRQELANLVAALAQTVVELDAARLKLEADAKQAVVGLAIAIADRVTKRIGALDPQVAQANVEEALRLVVHSADVRIAVHPSQKQMLEEVLPRIQAAWPQLKHVELIADGTLIPGGCRVFSGGGGQIDGDLNLQLERIAQELVPSRQEEPA
jgi:flagellar biosynthesis/type III secretory pathway protein FliH